MPEPLPAEVVAARLAETLALCGWEAVAVTEALPEIGVVVADRRPGLTFTARPLRPVLPAESPYGAESSLTGARRRVRDRTHVISALVARGVTERQHLAAHLEATGEVIPGEVDES